MSAILIYPTYFPSISHYVAMVQSDQVTFEVDDHFQKQTHRNRTYIYSPNGKQLLYVPIQHIKIGAHQKTKDVKIDYSENWQKQHFKSLEAAYRSSPFFEYFEDEFIPIFEKKQHFLLDLNLEVFEVINNCLGIQILFEKTTEYFHKTEGVVDLRPLANGKKDFFKNEPYTQVFEDRFGFLENLSIMDLLCSEGRYALEYLQKQPFPEIIS
jgi:hypothetical protein